MSFCTGFNLGFLTVTSLFRAKSCKQSVCSHILGFFGVQNRLNLPIRVNGLIFKKTTHQCRQPIPANTRYELCFSENAEQSLPQKSCVSEVLLLTSEKQIPSQFLIMLESTGLIALYRYIFKWRKRDSSRSGEA